MGGPAPCYMTLEIMAALSDDPLVGFPAMAVGPARLPSGTPRPSLQLRHDRGQFLLIRFCAGSSRPDLASELPHCLSASPDKRNWRAPAGG